MKIASKGRWEDVFRVLIIAAFLTGLSGLVPVWGQVVEYGNNETGDYGSSYKSSNFTYLMWDRNDDGDGNFSNNSTPKFFYWDNDASKLNYLLDTGNMSQLDAEFNSVVIDGNGDALLKVIDNENGNSLQIGTDNQLLDFIRLRPQTGQGLAITNDGDKIGVFVDSESSNVGIGTTDPTSQLSVNGTAKAEEVIVTENVGADFVFEEDYNLPKLNEVEDHIKKHKHLPEIPSAKEMKQNGVKVGDLQMKLLQKIEELTMYTIEQQKEMNKLRAEFSEKLQQQQQEIEQLKQLINSNH